MFLGVLTMITALSISAVAIYYSVAGLVAIFAAAAVPIIIMGSVLEIAKLVAAIWLHRYWNSAVWWLKGYLTLSVIVLMFITSMGIFGFLSKAHIDQTASATEGLARIEQIDLEIARLNEGIEKSEQEIVDAENRTAVEDQSIQEQIDREQSRIDGAYSRIQPAIDEQNSIIEREERRLGSGVALYESQLAEIDDNLQKIEEYISTNNVVALQALVGVEADGNLGPATERAIESFRSAQNSEKQRLAELIAQESTNIASPTIDAARAEIQRLRGLAEKEIADSNALISRLRSQLGNVVDTTEIDRIVEEETKNIQEANESVRLLTEEKYTLEAEYRKLEAEVGPIKYLAEFIYGNSADKDLLEEAVRWVIITIIFVFDPLAVLLLIASQYTFELHRKQREDKESHRRDLAQPDDIIKNEIVNRPDIKHSDTELFQETVSTIDTDAAGDTDSNSAAETVDSGTNEDVSQYIRTEPEQRRLEEERIRHIEEFEKLDTYKSAKLRWKADNPDKTIKEFKEAYIQGRIDHLPWDGYVQNSEQNDNSLWNKIRSKDE